MQIAQVTQEVPQSHKEKFCPLSKTIEETTCRDWFPD